MVQTSGMTAPQTQKRVGAGGCLVSLFVFVLSIAAFIGIVVWATLGVVDDLKAAPSVPLGSSAPVSVTNTGTQYLFMGNLDSGGSIPLADPLITVTDPSGNEVRVSASTTTSSSSSGSASFRSIGEFNATTAGNYTIDTTGAASTASTSSRSGTKVYVTNLNVGNLGAKLLTAFGVGGLLFLLSLILAIVWLVRRSKAKKSTMPPYQGGYPTGGYQAGAYPPGAPGGYPPAYPQYPPPGGPPPGAR